MRALVGLLGIWIVTGGPFGKGSLRRRRLLYALRLHWARSHMGGIRVLFGLRFEIEDLDQAAPGPIVIMMRHASIIDNVLPDYTVTAAHGIGLRFVLKRELQIIPTIDIGGRWVPTVYVRRASTDPEGEIAVLATLADDLGPGEGILIYPEGTRATAKKIARAQEVIAERQPEISPMANRLAQPPAAAPRRAAGAARARRGRRRRLLRPRRLRRLSVHLRHLGRRPRRPDDPRPLLALPGGLDPRRTKRARTHGSTSGGSRLDDWIGDHRRGDAPERRALD